MASDGYGRWESLPLAEAVCLFESASFPWWVAGGHALELHLGRSWREHGDIDISIRRSDVKHLAAALQGWDIHLAADGEITPWSSAELSADRSENNLWCRSDPDAPWSLDITIADGNANEWIYRRDPAIRVPWSEAVLASPAAILYLAPELQLLFKSKAGRPKDTVDAEAVIPLLDRQRRSRLASYLSASHPWQTIIAAERARLVAAEDLGLI